MITFFRMMRQKELKSNSVIKYLLYGIGEILLVVIGILIAIQVDNWNNERLDRKKEQAILSQLKKEYQANLKQLDEKIFMRDQMIESAMIILSYSDFPDSLDEDSFYTNLGSIMRDPTFDPIENDIIGTENLRLIKNTTLVQILSNWSSDIMQVQEIEKQYQTYRTMFLFPATSSRGIGRNLQHQIWKNGYTPVEALDKSMQKRQYVGNSKTIPDLKRIIQDVEFEGTVATTITMNLVANIQSQALRSRIIEILDMIDGELE